MNVQQENICKFLYNNPNSSLIDISLAVMSHNSVILWSDIKKLIKDGFIINARLSSHVETYSLKPNVMKLIFL